MIGVGTLPRMERLYSQVFSTGNEHFTSVSRRRLQGWSKQEESLVVLSRDTFWTLRKSLGGRFQRSVLKTDSRQSLHSASMTYRGSPRRTTLQRRTKWWNSFLSTLSHSVTQCLRSQRSSNNGKPRVSVDS